MAKYRITSIPQYAPGGETDRSKRKKKTYEDQPMVEVQGVDQPSYWNQMSSDIVQGKECPPGRENFEGNCLTQDEILSILYTRKAEMALKKLNKTYSMFENPQLASNMLGRYIYNKNRREQEDKDEYQSYISGIQKNIKKGNKHKKETLKPFITISKEKSENPEFQAWYNNTEDPDRANYYVEKKDLGDGNYEFNLYPKEGIAHMMSQAGMKPGEFEKHHGLNAQQLQTEFGDYLGALDKFHIKQGAEMINNLTKQGYSAEDAKRQLVKTGYNSKQGVTQFTGIANDLDFQNNADNYFVDDSGIMYKKDKYGNVYKYTNEYANDDFSLIKGTETKESESPFSKDKESGKEYINPFNWEKVDSKKIKTDAQGNINVNGKNTSYYGYGFGNRAGDKNEANILSQYKNDINKYYTDTEKQIKDSEVDQQQERYTEMNNMLYDAVYNNTGTKIAPITPVYGVHNDYANEFNKAAQQINSIEGNSQDDVAKRAKILNDFFTKAKTFNSSYIAKVPKEYNADGSVKSYHDKKLDVSQLGNYGDKASVVYLDHKGTRNAKAYKNSGDLEKAMGDARNNAAEELLRYAYTNKINPGSESLNYKGYDGSKYTGEEEYETLPFDVWKQTPEAQEFIANYNKDPKYGEKIYDVEKNRAEKKWQDYQDENSLWKKPTLSNFLEKAGQQISSLANQPLYTLNQWASGNAADPMIGLMSDSPTSSNINDWEAKLGPGGARLFLDNYTKLNSGFGTQIANLINPAHFASNVGFGLRNLYEGDPEQEVGDVLLNAAFAGLPASKSLRAASATKLLPGVKTLSKVGARGLAKNALYNATRNLVTPGAGLTGLFVKDAFMPTGEIDPYTGREIQGFGVEAGQNIWNEIQKAKEKAQISNSLPSSSSLDFLAHLDSDKVKENLFGLGMAGMIGLHGGKTALGFGKDLLRGAPNYLPAGTRLLNDKYNFEMDPALFNQQYFNRSGLNATGLNPKEPLRLRKEGGDLPQAQMGWPPKGWPPSKILKPAEIYSKQFLRSHYNPLSYPIKVAGSKVAGLSEGAFRESGEIAKALFAKEGDLKYKGQQANIVKPGSEIEKLYKEGGRDLVKTYMLGNKKGIQELVYDFEKDPGLKEAIDYYGPLKAYELYSRIGHGQNLGIQDFMNSASGFGFNKGKVIDDLMSGFDQNLNIFDQSKNTRLLFDLKRDLGEEAGNAKYNEIAKDNLNYLFDQYGNDIIPFQANVDPMATKDLILRGNPIMPLDDIGGHMAFLKKGADGNYDFTTRDLWSFRPDSYGKRYAQDSTAKALFKNAQVQLMDTFGKPFILHQTNPIKFKEGGDLPKAKMGWPPGSFRLRRKTPTVFGREVYRPSSTIFNTGIKAGNTFTPTERISTYGNVKREYPINFEGTLYNKNLGEPIYNVDPLDYGNAANWQQQGILDFLDYQTKETKTNFPELEKNVNNVKGSDISIDLNQVGDFRFQDFSDGWEARKFMMNAFDGPQWAPGKNDFYTVDELSNLINKQQSYLNDRATFDEMYPEDPGMRVFNALRGDTSRDELFSNLFPNSGMQNFKQKFYSPELINLMKNTSRNEQGQNLYDTLISGTNFNNNELLNKSSLKSLTKGEDTLPRTYQDLLKSQKGNWFAKAPARDVVMEMRGTLGLKIEDVQNATPEQFEKWRQQIVKKKNIQLLDRWNRDIEKPFKGSDAWNQITSQPGWKNKNGGIAMKLTKKQIDKYVQGGYIVEEE
jgi:hypothetical protein